MSRKNSEGYKDPTADSAIGRVYNVDKERARMLISTINYICSLAGFRIKGEITLVDTHTGKTWRK